MGYNGEGDRARTEPASEAGDLNSDADSIDYSEGSYLSGGEKSSLGGDEDVFDSETQQHSGVSGNYGSDMSEEPVADESHASSDGVDDVHDSFEEDTDEDAAHGTGSSSADRSNDDFDTERPVDDRASPSGLLQQSVTTPGQDGSSDMQDSNDAAAIFGHHSQGSDDVFGDSFGGGLDDFNTSF